MPRWTPETRLKQATAIRTWMPWTLSTGPVTAAGKARVARNGWKGGVRAKVSNWHRTVGEIVLNVEKLYSLVRPKRQNRQVAAPGPVAAVQSPVSDWNFADEAEEEDDDDDDDENDERDSVDRMSAAEIQAALSRLSGWKAPPVPVLLNNDGHFLEWWRTGALED